MRTIKVQLAVECDACDLRVEANEEYPNTSHIERCTNESLTNMIRNAQLTAFGPDHYLCPTCIENFAEWADDQKAHAEERRTAQELARAKAEREPQICACLPPKHTRPDGSCAKCGKRFRCEGCDGSGAARDGQGGCPDCMGEGVQ